MNLPSFYRELILKEDYFDCRSNLHGLGHTYRVMYNCCCLGEALMLEKERDLAVCAAFIHDMARRHDGWCQLHGSWSAERKFPLFIQFFRKAGIDEKDFDTIRRAVKNHSEPFEYDSHDPDYLVTAILKDADALDRVRLGDGNLNPDYIRLRQTHGLIAFAYRLYEATRNISIPGFTGLVQVAASIRR
jgi:HD superfamily phosphodiesterase